MTPAPGEIATGPQTEVEHIQQALGITAALERGDRRPTLVYFHWPHDESYNGKLSTTICTRVLDDEHAARWGKLFRCVQVDMAETKPEYAERIGAGSKPCFAAIAADLEVRARFDGKKSGSKLRKAIEAAFKSFPDYRKEIKAKMTEHRKLLARAKRLEKADKLEAALELVDEIRFGDVRVHKEFEKACAYGMLLSQKRDRMLEKDG